MAVSLVPIGEGKAVAVDKAIMLVGRNADCDIVLKKSRKISRKHCCVTQVENRFFVRDLGSMNGVWINGERVKQQGQIKIGDEVAFGDVSFRLTLVEEKAAGRNGSKKQADELEEAAEQQDVNPLDLSRDVPIPVDDDLQLSLKEESSAEIELDQDEEDSAEEDDGERIRLIFDDND